MGFVVMEQCLECIYLIVLPVIITVHADPTLDLNICVILVILYGSCCSN